MAKVRKVRLNTKDTPTDIFFDISTANTRQDALFVLIGQWREAIDYYKKHKTELI